jgi:hypothetical protein
VDGQLWIKELFRSLFLSGLPKRREGNRFVSLDHFANILLSSQSADTTHVSAAKSLLSVVSLRVVCMCPQCMKPHLIQLNGNIILCPFMISLKNLSSNVTTIFWRLTANFRFKKLPVFGCLSADFR